MFNRIIPTVVAAAVLVAMQSAHAASVQRYDRTAFDGTPEVTAAGWSISAATNGELDGWLDLSVSAIDGTVPGPGQCEPASVSAVLTVAPGESFAIRTTADLCGHAVDGSPSLFGSFGAKQVTYTGTHKKTKLVRDGFVSFGAGFLGAQGGVTMSVRW